MKQTAKQITITLLILALIAGVLFLGSLWPYAAFFITMTIASIILVRILWEIVGEALE